MLNALLHFETKTLIKNVTFAIIFPLKIRVVAQLSQNHSSERSRKLTFIYHDKLLLLFLSPIFITILFYCAVETFSTTQV